MNGLQWANLSGNTCSIVIPDAMCKKRIFEFILERDAVVIEPEAEFFIFDAFQEIKESIITGIWTRKMHSYTMGNAAFELNIKHNEIAF